MPDAEKEQLTGPAQGSPRAPHGPVVTWPEARHLAHAVGRAREVVELPLRQAVGATLAGPLRALAPLPAQDVSAMDGYAVAGNGPWTVRARVLAGSSAPPLHLGDGEAVEIATAAVPLGHFGPGTLLGAALADAFAALPPLDAPAPEAQLVPVPGTAPQPTDG